MKVKNVDEVREKMHSNYCGLSFDETVSLVSDFLNEVEGEENVV